MAGSYPDVPSRRMAYDADGTVVAHYGSNPATSQMVELTGAQVTELNDEDNTDVIGPGVSGFNNYRWVLIFPELREFDGLFIAKTTVATGGTVGAIHSSGDTTNGFDGTWTQRIADFGEFTDAYGNYRTQISSLAVSNVRGIRISRADDGASQRALRAVHVYGEISAGETPDRLLWVDNASGLEFSLPIDYGDIPRGSAEDYEVKLRNNSSTLSATSVQVTAESLHLNSGAWYTIKEAGGSFQSTLALTSSIGSSSDSPVLTIRRITPDAETLGLHAGRVYANVGSWS